MMMTGYIGYYMSPPYTMPSSTSSLQSQGYLSSVGGVPPADRNTRNDWRRTGGKNRHIRRRVRRADAFSPLFASASLSRRLQQPPPSRASLPVAHVISRFSVHSASLPVHRTKLTARTPAVGATHTIPELPLNFQPTPHLFSSRRKATGHEHIIPTQPPPATSSYRPTHHSTCPPAAAPLPSNV